MPLLRKRRVLAAKIETTVGTAISVAAADATFNIFEPELNPQIDYEERAGQGVFSPLSGCPGAQGGVCKFSTEITGRGASGAAVPAWASTFLPACGYVDSGTGVFSPKSYPPGTGGVKTITIGSYEDGLKKVLRGCMGTFVITLTSGKRAMIEFTFTGIWDDPSDATILAPTYITVAPLRFVSSSLAVGSWSPKVSVMTIDAGNQVILREDSSDPSGYFSALITDRKVTGSMDPEASLVATEDTYNTQWLDRAQRAMALQLGSGTNRVDIDAPKLQITNVQEGDRNKMQIDTCTFQCNRSAAAGDDELTIDFN